MLNVTILDGYVDEPTCLGVPPYISPYPRYIAGSIWSFDPKPVLSYLTIDQLRNDKKNLEILSKSNLVVVIAGMSVPGRYLSGFPLSPNEIPSILKDVNGFKVLTGPAARHGFGMSGGKQTRDTNLVANLFDLIIKGDAEIVINDLLRNRLKADKADPDGVRKDASAIRDYSVKGAKIVQQHPFYPDHLITEIETYRGCPRYITGGCSFCSEPSKGSPDFRPVGDVVDEIQSLYNNGIRHIRLGNQPCIFSYMAKGTGKLEFPRPNPDAIEKLLKGIRNVAPELKTFHIDNANPGVLARYPKECEKIAKTIIRYHTSGDVAAMGVESVDPVVIKKNNLKASEEEVFSAIKLLNKIGSQRGSNGMPELLPGLNFVFGLDGETKRTFDLDYNFLKKIMDNGLMVRRINLRQVIPIPGTHMYNVGNRFVNRHKSLFQHFKNKVQREIMQPMLKRMLPAGVVLRSVYSEKHDGKLTLGRQMGSYPLLVGIPGKLDLGIFSDVRIVDYGFRSVTGVPSPLDVNTASRETLEAVPGLGRKRVIRILRSRPFKDEKQFVECLDDEFVAKKTLGFVSI
jgi:radical SAM superfamily enzyme with C-terminal helix-hairpin-helix motif